MLPLPSRTALAALLGLGLLMAMAIGIDSALLAAWAGLGLLGVTCALAATVPLGRRVRDQRLEFAWWLGQEGGAEGTQRGEPRAASDAGEGSGLVTGSRFALRCYVRNRGESPLRIRGLTPVSFSPVRLVDAQPHSLRAAGVAKTEFDFVFESPNAGRVVFQGMAMRLQGPLGLFDIPLYFPNPLALRILPRATRLLRLTRTHELRLFVERSGAKPLRQRGRGTELHELRELQSGDSFRSIAWRASARRGRLLVKEVEHEFQETSWLLVDASGTMRDGEPGSRKLDYALELATAEGQRALTEGGRVGLFTLDGRILGRVAARDGTAHLPQLYDALLATNEIVDEDLTTPNAEELLSLVAEYLRHQEGLDFRKGRDARMVDRQGLLKHVVRSVPTRPESIRANSLASYQLRRFCRLRGIPLPHRAGTDPGQKASGIKAALIEAAGLRREPSSLAVITDLVDTAIEDLIAPVRHLRTRGHRLCFFLIDGRTFFPPMDRALRIVRESAERQRLQAARSELARAGVLTIMVPELGRSPRLPATHRTAA